MASYGDSAAALMNAPPCKQLTRKVASGIHMDEAAAKARLSKNDTFRFLEYFLVFAVSIYVFANPFPHRTAIENLSFYLSLLSLLVLIGFRKFDFSVRYPLSIPLFLFAAWAVMGLFFAFNLENSLHDIYAHLAKYIVFFYLLVNCYRSEKRFVALVWVIVVSTSAYAMGTMIFDYVIIGHPVTTKLGFYVHDSYKGEIPSNLVSVPTLFGLFLALNQFSHSTNKYVRIVLLICICTLCTATLATQARGTIVAVLVALSFFFLVRNRKLLIVFIALLVFVVMLMPARERFTIDYIKKTEPRPATWLLYFEIVKEHPLVGMGYGMQTFFNDELLARFNARVPEKFRGQDLIYQPHNMLVDIAARTGAVGLMLWLFVLFTAARTAWIMARKGKDMFIRDWGLCLMTAGTALFIQGMFENILSGPPVIILYSIMGMTMILWRLNRDAANGDRHSTPEAEAQ